MIFDRASLSMLTSADRFVVPLMRCTTGPIGRRTTRKTCLSLSDRRLFGVASRQVQQMIQSGYFNLIFFFFKFISQVYHVHCVNVFMK